MAFFLVFAPRDWPTREVQADDTPSPRQKVRELTWPTIWEAAKAAVPTPAISLPLIRKPIRMQTDSRIVPEPTLTIAPSVDLSKRKPLNGRSDRYPLFCITKTIAITLETQVPIAVAIAAPRTPRAGKPKCPLIRQ